jgi:uncharacterized protein (DUF2141 family)
MKYTGFILFALWGQYLYSQTFNLSITIINIKGTEGEIQIGLYNNKESFPLVDKQYKLFLTDVNSFSGIFTVNDLPKGEYAVAIFHDENSDKICNTNFIGIPKEGFGFSKNYKPKIFKPTFDDCKIDLISDLSITIKLIYR